MKKYKLLVCSFFYAIIQMPCWTFAQDTFSICAVDSVTGQVGSAGATCITSASTSAIIISDVHPGVGVIHSQASYLAANQNYARILMDSGYAPARIIDSLVANDVQNNPLVRQYGIVDLVNGVHSAAYTGSNCSNYKNHITGINYSIQGNILLGQEILDSMQSRFVNTPGSLACKLMAALQGAKVIGADTRCAPYGVSTYSAFIRVAEPADTTGPLYLDLTVNTFPGNHDPIDSLQVLFDNWGGCSQTYVQSENKKLRARIFPNPAYNTLKVELNAPANELTFYNLHGEEVLKTTGQSYSDYTINVSELKRGMYFIKVSFTDGEILNSRIVVNSHK